jgi:hypothetical protein
MIHKIKYFTKNKNKVELKLISYKIPKERFYVKDNGVINEYFYDSYEGWYIRSYYNGFKYNYGC